MRLRTKTQNVFKNMEEIMDFGTALLYVLAVLAIIAAAGFVIYLLASLVVSIIDKKEVKPFAKNEDIAKENEKIEGQQLLLENRDYELSLDDKEEEESNEEPKELDETIDLDLAEEEKHRRVDQWIDDEGYIIYDDVEATLHHLGIYEKIFFLGDGEVIFNGDAENLTKEYAIESVKESCESRERYIRDEKKTEVRRNETLTAEQLFSEI